MGCVHCTCKSSSNVDPEETFSNINGSPNGQAIMEDIPQNTTPTPQTGKFAHKGVETLIMILFDLIEMG